jgi:hypothetical protein
MTDIETKYLQLVPDWNSDCSDEEFGLEIEAQGRRLETISGIDLKTLFPGNIPEVLLPKATESDQSTIIDELIVIQSVNIVKTISDISSKWNENFTDGISDVENITSLITSLDTDFKTILNRKDSNKHFNKYPLHNRIINSSFDNDGLVIDGPVVVENSDDVSSVVSIYVSDGKLKVSISTFSTYLHRYISVSSGIFQYSNINVDYISG